MHYGFPGRILLAPTVLVVAACTAQQPGPAAAPNGAATRPASIDLRDHWKFLKEGSAEGQIEADAAHPASGKTRLLRIQLTKHPRPGEGRAGAANDIGLNVEKDRWYDIRFAGLTERGSIGLVFSLESADGRVLARTTLPEIGRMPRRPPPAGGGAATRPAEASTTGPATATAPRWTNYLVSLHARSAGPHARLVIYPIEPTNVWLEGLTLTPRPAR